jgi:hypothetical protein
MPTPSWMKSQFSDDEHRVWESIFPPDHTGSAPDIVGLAARMSPRRRRPGALHMSKIVRSFAEVGVFPVFRTTSAGVLVPWDTGVRPHPSWATDLTIRALLGHLAPNTDPKCNVDAWYHPADLAAHLGAMPERWVNWAYGMAGTRFGPSTQDVVFSGTLDGMNMDYLRGREVLRRPRNKVRLISSGAAAFFAAAATQFWQTADERAQIGRIKQKLELDFLVLRNESPMPEDPAIADILADTSAQVAAPESAPPDVVVPEHVPPDAVVVKPDGQVLGTDDLESELAQLEARATALRHKIEARRRAEDLIREAKSRYDKAVRAFAVPWHRASVVELDLDVPPFNPDDADRDPTPHIRIRRIGIRSTLDPDGDTHWFVPAR